MTIDLNYCDKIQNMISILKLPSVLREVVVASYPASFLSPGLRMTYVATPSFRTLGAQKASVADAFDGSTSLDNVK